MNEDLLIELHGKVVESLLKKIKDGTATASDLSVAVKLLKDNGIDCDGRSNPDVTSLADQMDFPIGPEDDVGLH